MCVCACVRVCVCVCVDVDVRDVLAEAWSDSRRSLGSRLEDSMRRTSPTSPDLAA